MESKPLKIIQRNVSELIPAEYNPRQLSKKQFADIKASIQRFGFVDPIIVNTHKDRKNIIIGGHMRVRVAEDMGMAEVPCVELSLTAEQEKELNIRLNKNSGEWDHDALANYFDTAELLDWGFSQEELSFFGNELTAEEDGFEVPDEIETDIVKGDVFEIGQHRLMCGDSTLADDVNKLLDGGKPILMVTDPPYGVNYDPDWRNRADRANGKHYDARAIGTVTNDDQVDWSLSYNLFTGNVCYVWHGGRHAKTVQQNLEDSGFDIIAQIIWAKNGHVISRGDYHFQHEPCLYAVRKGKKHNWTGSRSETSLWKIDRPQKSETGHSTQKPIECMARPIRNNTYERESCYDPFLGSGTTMVAAHQLNRKCYGMEISPQYCQVIVDRMLKLDPNIEIKKNGEAYVKA